MKITYYKVVDSSTQFVKAVFPVNNGLTTFARDLAKEFALRSSDYIVLSSSDNLNF